jgi:hypothetical protein
LNEFFFIFWEEIYWILWLLNEIISIKKVCNKLMVEYNLKEFYNIKKNEIKIK